MAKKTAPREASWTVIILMGADNLEGEEPLADAANDDLREIREVGADPAILQIVVHVDRRGGPTRFHFGKQQNDKEYAIPPGEGTSGPDVLENLLVWAKGYYPARHYLLLLWGHAYRLAFNRDPETPEGLNFPQLREVLENTNEGEKIDIVAFDSCNVSLIEAAYELRETASYLVASQFTDPLPGWPYDKILGKLRDSTDHFDPPVGRDGNGPKDFGRAIVSQFARHYEGEKSVTMTMLDLSRTTEIAERIGTLENELTIAVSNDQAERSRVREMFQRSQVPLRQPSVDLVTFCWNVLYFSRNERAKIAAAALGDLLLGPKEPFIVEHARTDLLVGMLNGVSILAPNVVTQSRFDLGSLRSEYDKLDLAQYWGNLAFALAQSD